MIHNLANITEIDQKIWEHCHPPLKFLRTQLSMTLHFDHIGYYGMIFFNRFFPRVRYLPITRLFIEATIFKLKFAVNSFGVDDFMKKPLGPAIQSAK